MRKREQDSSDEAGAVQRRFKHALYVFAVVEFLVIALAVYYKIRH